MTDMERLVSIPKSDLESLEATIETLQNKYVMEQLEKSEKDIIKGRVRNIGFVETICKFWCLVPVEKFHLSCYLFSLKGKSIKI